MTAQPHGANIVRRQSRSDNTVMDCIIYIRNRVLKSIKFIYSRT